jgi:hypothetical protein
MNLKGLKFQYKDNTSLVWESNGEQRQNVQKYTVFRGVTIYVRYENYLLGREWRTRKTTYSLDKSNWTEHLTDIQAALKKLGK